MCNFNLTAGNHMWNHSTNNCGCKLARRCSSYKNKKMNGRQLKKKNLNQQ